MFKNYLVTAIGNLLKNKLFSLINITGLAIGLMACVLIALYVQNELSYDTQWEKSEQIYRINMTTTLPGRPTFTNGKMPGPLFSAFKNSYGSDVESGTRAVPIQLDIAIGELRFNESIYWVDQQFTDLFQFDVIAGTIRDTLLDTSSIAISEELAIKFFGNDPALNEVITLTLGDTPKNYRVTAIYRLPESTVLQIPALTLIDENEARLESNFSSWFNFRSFTFIQIAKGSDIEKMTSRAVDFLNTETPFGTAAGSSASSVIGFQAVHDIHLNPVDTNEFDNIGNHTTVLIFAAISVLVVTIGCINFMILSTARASRRAREVAMRKTLGARRNQLIFQFIGESFLITLFAVVLSLVFVESLLPAFSALVNKTLSISYSDPLTLLALIALTSGVSLVGGAYPALVLSHFKPAHILKSNQSAEPSGSSLTRSVLVFFQFAVSISLIISTAVIYSQVYYAGNSDPGFSRENLLVIENINRPEIINLRNALTQEVGSLANVNSLALSSERPMRSNENNLSVSVPANSRLQQAPAEGPVLIRYRNVHFDFFRTYQIPLLAGRYYDRSYLGDPLPKPGEDYSGEILQGNVIVSQSAAEILGFGSAENAVGQIIQSAVGSVLGTAVMANLSIVGVVADARFINLRSENEPAIYYLNPTSPSLSVLTLNYEGESEEILQAVTEVWESVAGNELLTTNFIEQILAEQWVQEETEAKVLSLFSILAVTIACLGLFGVASFVVERRTKEIGLRKVMGARVKDVVRLLIWQFSKPVLLANVIAWPISIWIMLLWLERFPDRISGWLLIPICISAGSIAFILAWATIAKNARKIARQSPIKSLRYE